LAAQGVYFSGDVSFCGASDGAVAGKMADSIEAHRDARRASSHPCGRKGGFNPGVTGTYYDDIESLHESIVT
jgi:hypothetical protein